MTLKLERQASVQPTRVEAPVLPTRKPTHVTRTNACTRKQTPEARGIIALKILEGKPQIQ